MVLVTEITVVQRDIILFLEEDHFNDLKSKDIAPAKLTKSASGFANTAGGDLYIGIIETGLQDGRKVRKWQGFADPEAANGHIQCLEALSPLGSSFKLNFLRCNEEPGLVLHVQILKTREIIKASDGKVFTRKGAQNLPIQTDEELTRLRLNKGLASFESETVSIDLNYVTNSTVLLNFLLGVVPTAEPEMWLKKQMLIISEKATVAAVLLYAEEPQAILPKRCAIKLYRYKTEEIEGTRGTLAFDPLTIEGHLYEQIAVAVKKTVELVEGVQVMGLSGLEPIKYPNETLHEIITNAVLHRDYSVASDIHIRVYDNRVEVESPGVLPGHITTKNILAEQFARNGAIVRLINKFPDPPNKDVGEGLNTAFQAMRALRLKDPSIEERDNSVVVYIRHERLASPEEAVISYLETHTEINNSVARKVTGITSENKVKELFYRLRDAGRLERVPGRLGSASAWRKPDE